ncbi:MAG: hypothetical protein ACTSRZ_02345 [Promethearchaeota archaeon]
MTEQKASGYIRKMIKDLTSEDSNVQIIAKVIEKKGDTEFLLSDGTGHILAVFDNATLQMSKIRLNMTVKIFGNLLEGSTDIINVKLAADYSDLDFDSYKTAYELSKKYL